jgi:TusA-related sulfurtransferase
MNFLSPHSLAYLRWDAVICNGFPYEHGEKHMTDLRNADHELDITQEVCPMTFVRTRLALDRLASGQTLLVHLKGVDPVRNVPRTAREQGHQVLAMETDLRGITHLLLRRA